MCRFVMTYKGYDIYCHEVSASYQYYYLQNEDDFCKSFTTLDSIMNFIAGKPDVVRKKVSSAFLKTQVVENMPNGWIPITGAMTAPRGTMWIFNNKSHFAFDKNGNKLRKTALLIIDNELFETSNFYKERAKL